MATTAQKFFLGIVDDDQTGGTTIKKIQETAPATTSTTTDTWTTTTVETRTLIPLTGSTTNSDTSSSNGWCFNNGGADGLGSTASAERWIKAGTWDFSHDITLNAPALLATIACTLTARVYRVATGGGTRTLLFTAASSSFSATGVQTWSSASQPEYVLGSGEVIQVGYTASSAATAAVVIGAITNTVLTTNLGTNTWFQVPTPGVRTLSRGDYSMAGVGALAFVGAKVLGTVYTLAGTGAMAYVGAPIRTGTFTMAGTGALAFAGSSVAGTAYSMAGVGALAFNATRILSTVYTMGPSGGGGGTTIVKRFLPINEE